MLPSLPTVTLEDAIRLDAPTLKIRTDADVDYWKSSKGYQNYLLFLHRLSEAVVGHALPENPGGGTELSQVCIDSTPSSDPLTNDLSEYTSSFESPREAGWLDR